MVPSSPHPASAAAPLVRVAVVIVVVAVGVGLVILAPGVGVVLAWPVLFVVPGWIGISRTVPLLSPVGRLGAAIAASLLVSTHVVYVLGRLVGSISPVVVATAAGLVALGSWGLAVVPIPGLVPLSRPSLAALRRGCRTDGAAWTVAGAAAIGVAAVYRLSWHHVAGGWAAGGWNWSDLLLHVAHTASLEQGNFPPQVPYVAGAPLLYHWFGDFQAAIAATLSDLDDLTVMAIGNGVCAGSLALVLWELATSVTGSRRAGGLAAVLGVAGGGMGYIRLGMDLHAGAGSLADLISRHAYDGPWYTDFPSFRIASVLGTGLLAQRATAYGLAAMVTVVLLLHHSLGRGGAGVFAAGLLAALSAPFDLFSFPAVYLVAALQMVAARVWRHPGWGKELILFVLPAAYGASFALGPLRQQSGNGSLHLVAGWADSPLGAGPLHLGFFYVTNFGLPFLGAVAALACRSTPGRLWLGGWILALGVVANVVAVGALTEDAGRFLQLAWMPIALLAAGVFARWPRAVVVPTLVLSCASPLLTTAWYVRSDTIALSDAQVEAAHWIAGHTPPQAIFVTDAFVNSPVDLAGRLRLTTFAAYVTNLGFDPAPREAAVHLVYCGGDQAAAAAMRRYGATYVLSSSGPLDCGGASATDFSHSPRFLTVFDDEGVRVWWLRR